MMKLPHFLLFISFCCSADLIHAGDIKKGQEKSATCVACHGNDGISINPVWPKLAGQHAKYLETQLYEFQKGASGSRNNAVMYGIALTLTSEDIEDIKKKTESLVQSSMKLGEAIYKSQQNAKPDSGKDDGKDNKDKKDDNVVDADFEEVKEEKKDENQEKSA